MGAFDQKVVLITGASAGLGLSLAREIARQGGDLILTARRKERLDDLAKEIQGMGRKALALSCDVTQDGDLEAAVAASRSVFPAIDIVVANAGFGVVGFLEELTNEDIRRQFETNVYGVHRTFLATIGDLRKTKGIFSVVGSVAGQVAMAGNGAYCMSKFAIRAYCQSLRAELARDGIAVVLISPGFVNTEIHQVDNFGVYHPDAKNPIPVWLKASPEVACRHIARAIRKKKREAIITGHGKFIVFMTSHFPGFVAWIVKKSGLKARRPPQENKPPTDGKV